VSAGWPRHRVGQPAGAIDEAGGACLRAAPLLRGRSGPRIAALAIALAVCPLAFGVRAQPVEAPASLETTPQVLRAGKPAPNARPATVLPPRAYGGLLGDVIEQRILLGRGSARFEPALPTERERVSAFFERRPSDFEEDAQGRRWMVARYQVINIPPERRQVRLPGWNLMSRLGQPPLFIAPSTVQLMPMSEAEAPEIAGLRALQPPQPVPLRHAGPWRGGRDAALALAGLSALGWLGWWVWRNRRAAGKRPFARALKDLHGCDGTTAPAWMRLHRAFDRAAGHAVDSARLATLYAAAPWLRPAADEIDVFYRQSDARFFGGAGAGATGQPCDAVALCRRLRRLERRGEA